MAKSSPEFRALTVKAQGRRNKIFTPLEISKAFDPEHPPSPDMKLHTVQALWDTGATGSVISPKVVNALGLHATGTVKVCTAGGEKTVRTYLVNLYLPNKVAVAGVIVCETDALVGFDAIIGVDIITQGDFAITNVGGRTCVSFRYPSIETVDFVQQANRIRHSHARRNAPCPCGKTDANGKPRLYKRCCGRKRGKEKRWPAS